MEWVESIGDSIELAKEQALDRLGVHEDDAEFDVLSDVKTGLFGRVKEPARVRARVRPKTPRAKESRGRRDRGNRRGRQGQGNRNGNNNRNQDSGKRQQDRPQNGRSKKAKSDRQTASQQAEWKAQPPQKPRKKAETVNQDQEMMPLPQQADIAEDFVRGLAERFGTTVDFHRENIGSDEIRITVSGDQLGRMVGHRGMTAGAIDDLIRTVLQRRAGSARNGRVRVDVGGVIARRNEALVRFAREQALEVQDSGAPRSLEPMNAADRKIVHDAVDGTAGVQTISEGDDPRRYVVIVPSE
ncbi:MAG: Jag N-terminal domain-containing protein [Acidimicrobiaceae bacterium]|nr:Jag N-terminal domain-containing protein [Acidimicrobiaceae bacterium]MDE0607421.1 Jag N-terminal domain-containing protein [Acidimicrobiaceae bacterium]